MVRNYNASETRFYKRKIRWLKTCVYCGERATQLDHVFPLSLTVHLDMTHPITLKELAGALYLVPACGECNRIAGSEPFYAILDKRRFIQKKLKEKYSRRIKRVLWDEDELEELGPGLRSKIISDMLKMEAAENRILYPYCNSRAKGFLDSVQGVRKGRK